MDEDGFPWKGEEMKMNSRKRIYLSIAASALSSCFTSNVVAQMPGTKFSPWNQLGRAWGIGIGDGYNECANCPKDSSKGYGINAFKTSSDQINAHYPAESSAWYSKLNPFSSSQPATACGVPGCSTCMQGSQPTHVVLPPSGTSYQHFTTPAETPLPWSSSPQMHYQPSTIPQHSMPPSGGYPYNAPPQSSRMVPDPIPEPRHDWDSLPPAYGYSPLEPTPATRLPALPRNEDHEAIEPQRMPDSASEDIPRKRAAPRSYERPAPSPSDDPLGNDYLLDASDVPPPPALRSRQPQDKPLGEFPGDEFPNRAGQPRQQPPNTREKANDSDSLLPMEDESFDLVPGSDLPPITQRRVRPTRQSTRAIPASASRDWNRRIQQDPQYHEPQYSDDGYSQRHRIGVTAPQSNFYPYGGAIDNRYR